MIEPFNLTEQCVSKQRIKPSLKVACPSYDRMLTDQDLTALGIDMGWKPTVYQNLEPRRTWSQRCVVLKDSSGPWLKQAQSFTGDQNAN